MKIKDQALKKPLITSLPLEEMRTLLHQEHGFSKFSADQIFDWVYKKKVLDPFRWSNVSKKLKEFLSSHFDFSLPKIIWSGMSQDGTRKYLVQFRDEQVVECVLIKAKDRLTLCLSSQVGCAIGCTFCHTGTQGLSRHLSAGEIVGHLLTLMVNAQNLSQEERVSNLVFMGQGEPLHNFEAAKASTEIFLEPKGLGIGQRKVTLSTSGLCPQIERLKEFPPVNIAISLHAAHDDVRTELMPINKVYDLKRLFESIARIPLKANRRITYEYILIQDLNDSQKDIDALCDLLERKKSKINLIPFNEHPASRFKRPPEERILWFHESLLKRGLTSTIRATKGSDILAACGQLKSEQARPNLWESPESGQDFHTSRI